MSLEHWEPLFADHPMVSDANIGDLSEGKRLADSVLRSWVHYLRGISSQGSLVQEHARWLMEVFPDLSDIPEIERGVDLVTEAQNVGNVKQAGARCYQWAAEGRKVSYWTGGLEFTRAHHAVAEYLLDRKETILLGIEPFCYPREAHKFRGAISESSVPISLWSRLLGERGFVFYVPRPLPESLEDRDNFYTGLFEQVTQGQARIVVSERDPHKADKLKRGEIIEVPYFEFPSTTELWESSFG